MKKWLGVFLVAVWLVMALVLCSEGAASDGRFYISPKGVRVWEAPGAGWELRTNFVVRDLRDIEEFMSNKPPEVAAGRLFEVMLAERGVWMGFSVKFCGVDRVVFTKGTKIVLIDKDGKRYESDGCFFTPDVMQTQVYDTRKMTVIVTKKTVFCHSKTGLPLVDVKFHDGEFRLKDLVEFEVVGVIGDTLQRAAQ
jgi:hypothetical protein